VSALPADPDPAAQVLVPLDALRRRLGYATVGDVHAAARAHATPLDPAPDWTGAPAVPAWQAATLVRRVEARHAELARAKRARAAEHVAATDADDRRLVARARAAYQAGAEQFGDPGVAVALYYRAADPRTSDQELAAYLGEAAERWRVGFRDLQPPAPRRRDRDTPVDQDDLAGRDWLRSHGLDALDQPIPPAAARRLREVFRPGGPR
jgi:hypothetical protein